MPIRWINAGQREIIRRVREIQIRTGRQVADVLAGTGGDAPIDGTHIIARKIRAHFIELDAASLEHGDIFPGQPYVKRYVEERQLTLMLMADVSASQDFGSQTRSKREATAEFCALIAFSAIRNDDKVGLLLFHGGIEHYTPPRKGQKHALRVVRQVLAHGEEVPEFHREPAPDGGTRVLEHRHLASKAAEGLRAQMQEARRGGPRDRPASRARHPDRPVEVLGTQVQRLWEFLRGRLTLQLRDRRLPSPRRSTDIGQAVEFLRSVMKRRAVCFLVSDFLDEGFERILTAANRKHDIIAVLITDPRELAVPSVGLVALQDAESGRTRLYDTGAAGFRHELELAARERIKTLERRLSARGIDFIHIDATGSVVDPLVRFFRMRERRMRR